MHRKQVWTRRDPGVEYERMGKERDSQEASRILREAKDGGDIDMLGLEELLNRFLCGQFILYDERLTYRCSQHLFESVVNGNNLIFTGRLAEKAQRAFLHGLPLAVLNRDHEYGDMGSFGITFQGIEHVDAVQIGQSNI